MVDEKSQEMDEWAKTRAIHKEFSSFYKVLGGLAVSTILVLFGSMFFSGDNLTGYWANIYVTGVGTVFTIVVINALATERAKRERVNDLIAQLDSPSNDFAVEAARRLSHENRYMTDH